jgi:hypothetical protein
MRRLVAQQTFEDRQGPAGGELVERRIYSNDLAALTTASTVMPKCSYNCW